MEMPVVPGGKSNEKRRTGERRNGGRSSSDRRKLHDRRTDHLGRFIVSVLERMQLFALSRSVKSLAEDDLLGPVVMLLSAIVYFLVEVGARGWIIGFSVVMSLMVHESGHFLATKYCRLRPHWWWFVPVLGAVMRLPHVRTRQHEATIALGGPLLGGLFSAILFIVWRLLPEQYSDNMFVYQLVLISTLINVFNLIPISPLDGGRITQASHWFFQMFGFGILLLLSWYLRQPTLLLVWMVVAIERFLEYPLWRFVAVLACLFILALLVWFGYGTSSLVENIVFLLFGAFLVVMCHPKDLSYTRVTHATPRLAPLPFMARVWWGLVWTILTGTLGTLFVMIAEMAPDR